MDYVKVEFEQSGIAYMEVDRGFVIRYVDSDGNELFVMPPAGDGCRVLDAEPVPTAEMLSATATRAGSAHDHTKVDRRSGTPRRREDDVKNARIAELEAGPVDEPAR